MMMLCCKVLKVLKGKTLATAESCTGGMIGAAITAVPGSSAIYRGGVISYINEVKADLLDVPQTAIDSFGAVSAPVAEAMARGVRLRLCADVAVSVTGLAGPSADSFGNPVGTVFIGYSDKTNTLVREYHFSGDRESVRQQATQKALMLILELNQ